MENESRIIVTGANGFVGAEIMRLARISGRFLPVGIARTFPTDSSGDFLSADITDEASLDDAMRSVTPKTVIHAAGLAHQFYGTDAAEFSRVNVDGTANVCRVSAARGVERVVLVSSVSVYGDYGNQLVDESYECRPAGDYARSKYEAELAARKICSAAGVGLLIVRLATVCGPGDRGNTARLIGAIDRRRFVWIGDGSNRKTMIDRTDAAQAILSAAGAPLKSPEDVYNVCAEPVRMSEIVETIAGGLDRRIWPVCIPRGAALRLAGFAGGSIGGKWERVGQTISKFLSDDLYDGSRFCSDFEWRPQVPVAVSLHRQVEAYMKRKRSAA